MNARTGVIFRMNGKLYNTEDIKLLTQVKRARVAANAFFRQPITVSIYDALDGNFFQIIDYGHKQDIFELSKSHAYSLTRELEEPNQVRLA